MASRSARPRTRCRLDEPAAGPVLRVATSSSIPSTRVAQTARRGGHRFEDDVGHPLPERGQHEQVGGLQQVAGTSSRRPSQVDSADQTRRRRRASASRSRAAGRRPTRSRCQSGRSVGDLGEAHRAGAGRPFCSVRSADEEERCGWPRPAPDPPSGRRRPDRRARRRCRWGSPSGGRRPTPVSSMLNRRTPSETQTMPQASRCVSRSSRPMPALLALGHADAADHPRSARQRRGQLRRHVGMEQEAWTSAGRGRSQGRGQAKDRPERPAAIDAEARHVDAGLPQGLGQRPFGSEADDRGRHRERSSPVASATIAVSAPPTSRSVITSAIGTGRSGQGRAVGRGQSAAEGLHVGDRIGDAWSLGIAGVPAAQDSRPRPTGREAVGDLRVRFRPARPPDRPDAPSSPATGRG